MQPEYRDGYLVASYNAQGRREYSRAAERAWGEYSALVFLKAVRTRCSVEVFVDACAPTVVDQWRDEDTWGILWDAFRDRVLARGEKIDTWLAYGRGLYIGSLTIPQGEELCRDAVALCREWEVPLIGAK